MMTLNSWGEECCLEPVPGGEWEHYACSLRRDHVGDHAAYISHHVHRSENLRWTWPQDLPLVTQEEIDAVMASIAESVSRTKH